MDGLINYWNPGAERIFGYKAEEVMGKTINLLAPYKTDEHQEILDKYNKGIKIEHFETKRAKKDGSIIDVSLTVSPIYDDSGKAIGFSSIGRDVTQRGAIFSLCPFLNRSFTRSAGNDQRRWQDHRR